MMLLAILSVILLLLPLTIPVKYYINIDKQEFFAGEFRVMWLWRSIDVHYTYDSSHGLSKQINLFGKSIRFKSSANNEKATTIKKSRVEWQHFLDKALLQKTIGLLTDILKHIRPQTFSVNGRIGLDNPYHTAMTISILTSLNIPGVYIEPVFDDELFETRLLIQGRLIIGMAVILFVKFLAAKPVRNIIIKQIKFKGEKGYVY